MRNWMAIEYLKCKGDLNSEVDFGVNGAIVRNVANWNHILLG